VVSESGSWSPAIVANKTYPFWRVLVFGRTDEVLRPVCHAVRSLAKFRIVVATSQPGTAIQSALETRPHLVILDGTVSDGIGMKLARRLRGAGHAVEIITVGDATLDLVRTSCHLGAIDIVTLPARPDRFCEAADRFLKHMAALASMQEGGPVPVPLGRTTGRWLPKGITGRNVDLVRQALAADGSGSSTEIAVKVGLARVTCRRYLEYLVTLGEATARSEPTGPGRPRRVYEERQGPGRVATAARSS